MGAGFGMVGFGELAGAQAVADPLRPKPTQFPAKAKRVSKKKPAFNPKTDSANDPAWVAPVWRADGRPAVLKLGMPHMEGADELLGLRFWDGDPTVHLLEADIESAAALRIQGIRDILSEDLVLDARR